MIDEYSGGAGGNDSSLWLNSSCSFVLLLLLLDKRLERAACGLNVILPELNWLLMTTSKVTPGTAAMRRGSKLLDCKNEDDSSVRQFVNNGQNKR
jgi:hypothetical protein